MIHVVPMNDEEEHDLDSECRCKPVVHWQSPDGDILPTALVVHNSFDCREVSEEVTGECLSPTHKWGVYNDADNE